MVRYLLKIDEYPTEFIARFILANAYRGRLQHLGEADLMVRLEQLRSILRGETSVGSATYDENKTHRDPMFRICTSRSRST